MRVLNNILECVGNTPIIKLNRVGSDSIHDFYVKLEFMNPGASVKDRIAIQMVDDAMAEGKLKPGGTIVECTSGNTGMGLAMVAAVRGFQCVCVMPDKVSDEKVKALRAFGARVIVTPTAVEPEDPRSFYSVARKIAQETPNSFYANQYHNLSNPKAHYRSTGPEVWEQMGDKLDYVVIASGTGGTISGTTKYLKERNPKLKAISVDPIGSIFYDYFKTGKFPKLLTTYKVEGFGEDFIPGAIDFSIIDDVVQVSDKECFKTARDLVKQEGMFVGGSCGGAVAAALKYSKNIKEKKTFLIILPDSGSRYLSKVYDDDWMREHGFLEPRDTMGPVKDLLGNRFGHVITATHDQSLVDAVKLMKENSISQMPVLKHGELVGLIAESHLLGAMLDDPTSSSRAIEQFMATKFTQLSPEDPIRDLHDVFRKGDVALVVEDKKPMGVITKIDYISYLSGRVR